MNIAQKNHDENRGFLKFLVFKYDSIFSNAHYKHP